MDYTACLCGQRFKGGMAVRNDNGKSMTAAPATINYRQNNPALNTLSKA
jgi:hypothetical protein